MSLYPQGWTCHRCGWFVPNGCTHSCSVTPWVNTPPRPVPSPSDWPWKDGYHAGYRDGFEAGRKAQSESFSVSVTPTSQAEATDESDQKDSSG